MMETQEEIKSGYKLTKLGWIPEDWEAVKLSTVCKIQRGRFSPRPRNDPKFYGGDIPFVQTSDVSQSNGTVNNHSQTLNNEGLKVSKLFPMGTVLITIASNIGHSAILAYGMACPDSLIGLSVKESYNNEFLNYYLRLNQRRIEYDAPGAQKNINVEFLNPYLVLKPPIPEQKIIAKVLSTWDKAIEKLTKLIELKQQKKKALMQQLLTGKKRFAGFDGEWREVRLGDVFKRVTRKNDEDNTNVVTISAQRGLVRQNTFFKKNVASETLDNYFLLHKDEFAYNKSYSNGYPMGAIKRLKFFNKAVVTTLYICFDVIDARQTSRDFFEHFFEAGYLNRELRKVAHEGGRAHGLLNVTPSDFFNQLITIPEFEEQKAIASVVNSADKEVKLLQQKLEGLKNQKKGLMQQLLTGKKRIKIN